MKLNTIVLILLIIFTFGYCITKPKGKNVPVGNDPFIRFKQDEAAKKIDVLINDQLFTSFCWSENVFKPILNPVLSMGANPVTRGYPLAPRQGERIDHPHQIGMWLNYGDVDGYDFWNNSEAIPADQKNHYGTIRHKKVESLMDGKGEAVLITNESWIDPAGKELLSEKTEFHFIAGEQVRIIDRITTLTATGKKVSMKDSKEGLMAIRVARQLELPSKEELILIDSQGKPASVAKVDNENVTGDYRSSEGITGEAVWSTRARWMKLSGLIHQEKISIIMFDHPKNISYPTWWMARGYGLFAANPLGANIYTNGKETLNFSIPEGKSVVFRYRVLLHSGSLTDDQINQMSGDFAKRY